MRPILIKARGPMNVFRRTASFVLILYEIICHREANICGNECSNAYQLVRGKVAAKCEQWMNAFGEEWGSTNEQSAAGHKMRKIINYIVGKLKKYNLYVIFLLWGIYIYFMRSGSMSMMMMEDPVCRWAISMPINYSKEMMHNDVEIICGQWHVQKIEFRREIFQLTKGWWFSI